MFDEMFSSLFRKVFLVNIFLVCIAYLMNADLSRENIHIEM